MADFPATGTFDPDADMEAFLAAARQCAAGDPPTELTIASGSITPTGPAHTVDTEANAGTDNLDLLDQTNIRDGGLVILRPENTARVVTVRHQQGGDGQISLAGGAAYEMDAADDVLVLQRIGTLWREVFRARHEGSATHGKQLFSASGDFTVPVGITTVWVTAVGGGGGGGGGAGGGAGAGDGTHGNFGGETTFGAYVSGAGGNWGTGGLTTGQGGRPLVVVEIGGSNGQNAVGTVGGFGGPAVLSVLGNYGRSGAGGDGADDVGGGGGGGGSGSLGIPAIKQEVSGLTPGGTVTVTIGAGGAGGAAGAGASPGEAGEAGVNGACLVEW